MLKAPFRLNEKEQENHKRKGLCFVCHKFGHQYFQCLKRPHQVTVFGLKGLKEGGKIETHGMKDKGPM
jgi:hypothetical protein